MSLKRLNLLLMVLLVMTVGLNWFMRTDFSQPNREFLPEMVRSIPYDAYAANPVFPDQMTLRSPVPGTIHREAFVFPYQATPEEAQRAGAELSSPVPEDSAARLQQGDLVYFNFCLPCHGAEGLGDGPVVLRGYPTPPALTAEKAVRMADGQMFHLLTFGQGNMPAYNSQLPAEDRWAAILHLRHLQQRRTLDSAKTSAAQKPTGSTPGASP